MKTIKENLLAAMALGVCLSGCATKGPEKVSARPMLMPINAEQNWAVEEAPRTQPGKIMDPEAVTYAQIPSRIIYLPGSQGIFGRTAPRQEVAYNLIPVDRIPEVQAKGTPEFQTAEKRDAQNTSTKTVSVFPASFPDKEGNNIKGTARRLGVLGRTEVEEKRANGLLSRGEKLQWTPDVGWVGFTEEIVVRPPVSPVKQAEIKPLEETEATKPPQIELPTKENKEVEKPDASKDNNLKDLGLELTIPE